MKLIVPLAAGIRGAASGTAEIYRRGTSTRATYYNDFEGTSAVSTGANLALDANGGAVVYVNEFVRVVVRSSTGTVIRDFINGVSATTVDYTGPSFTGTNYLTAETGVNQPVALNSVFDLWAASAGATDFNVSYNGVATPLTTIAAQLFALSNVVIGVKTYGATGDGSTDDTAAINTAIAAVVALGGGIIYFAPGTYKITAAISLSSAVSIYGSGSASCKITQATAGAAVLTLASTASTVTIDSFTLLHSSAASAGVPEVTAANSTKTRFTNCVFGSSSRFTDHGISISTAGTATELSVDSCVFINTITGIRDLRTTAPAQPLLAYGCKFQANPTGTWTGIGSAYFIAENCAIDNSTQNSGTTNGFEFRTDLPASSGFASVTGCVFSNPTGGTATGINLPAVISSTATFFEDQNVFGGNVTSFYGAMAITFASKGAFIRLGSRESRISNVTTNINTTLRTDLYGTIVVTRTTNAGINLTLTMVPEGTRGRIIVFNSSGGTLTQTVLGPSANDFTLGAAGVTITNGKAFCWEYVGIHGAAVRHTLPIVDGKDCGSPT